MTFVQFDPVTRLILAYGQALAAAPDGATRVAAVSDAEAAKLPGPGTKTLAADRTITVDLSGYLAAQQADQQAAQDQQAERSGVVSLVQSCVGITWPNLTAAQKQSLIVALLYKFGALDKTLTVQPLAQWL